MALSHGRKCQSISRRPKDDASEQSRAYQYPAQMVWKDCQRGKTIEVRRTRPKLEPPFKVYIYCTKAEERLITILKDGDENYGEIYHGKPVFIKTNKPDNLYAYGHSCAVIGEFTCDRIYELAPLNHAPDDVEQQSCLTREEIVQYLRGTGYGWHISDLRIYDTLRELSEFWLYNEGLHKRYDAGEDFAVMMQAMKTEKR